MSHEQTPQEAFIEQYSVLFDRVYRFIHARIPIKEDANDLIGDVFAKCIKNLPTYDASRGNYEQWTLSIARNTVIDHWRTRKETVDLEKVEHLLEAPHGSHPENAIDFDLRIAALPLETQALLRLRYVDSLTHEEIAHRIDKQPTAIRSFFSRLHKQLRNEWK